MDFSAFSMSKPPTVASIVPNPFILDSRVEKEAKSLSHGGYNVTVHAMPSASLAAHEKREEYSVERMPLRTFSLGGGFFSQAIKLLEYSIRLGWHTRNVDVFHCHDYISLAPMLAAKCIFGAKGIVIYDSHELQSEQGQSILRSNCVFLLEWLAAPFFRVLITVSHQIGEFYKIHFNHPLHILVLNTPPLLRWSLLREAKKNRSNMRSRLGLPQEGLVLLMQGSLTPERGVGELLEAFKDMEDTNWNLVFIGNAGPLHSGFLCEANVKKAAQERPNIFYHQSVSYDELLFYTAIADVGVVMTKDTCLNNRFSLPNKFFEYAMVGIPLLVSDLPAMSNLVTKYDAGVICSEPLVPSIRNCLNSLGDQDLIAMGLNARRMAEANSWEKQEKILLQTYNKVIGLTNSSASSEVI